MGTALHLTQAPQHARRSAFLELWQCAGLVLSWDAQAAVLLVDLVARPSFEVSKAPSAPCFVNANHDHQAATPFKLYFANSRGR